MRAILAGNATNMGVDGAEWYLKNLGILPDYYISKLTAKYRGWIARLLNLPTVAPGKMIGGDQFYNDEGKLPWSPERVWYEDDINYTGGIRNVKEFYTRMTDLSL